MLLTCQRRRDWCLERQNGEESGDTYCHRTSEVIKTQVDKQLINAVFNNLILPNVLGPCPQDESYFNLETLERMNAMCMPPDLCSTSLVTRFDDGGKPYSIQVACVRLAGRLTLLSTL